jgi:vacuolar-type H+-ATPase subunit E/Vma4
LAYPGDEKHPLISGIENNAFTEAEKIKKEAEKQAAERIKYLDKQIDSILRDAEEKARTESDVIKNKSLSSVDVEIKRKELRSRDKMLNEIQERVKKELGALIGKEEYRKVLLNWISEAAIGLSVGRAFVSASVDEMGVIDRNLLAGAEKKVKTITGRSVSLKLSAGPVIGPQGVILTAEDGRTAFNNQVAVRLLRKQREIRKLINQELYGDI